MLHLACIYIIESADRKKKYIGSTTTEFELRMRNHKSTCKNFLDGTSKKYCSSIEILKEPGYTYKIIEVHENISKSDLRRREGELIQENNCINKLVAGRTKHETYKAWYQTNASKMKIKNSCFCGGCYTHQNKSAHFKTKTHQAAELKKIKSELVQIKKSNEIILKFVKDILAKKANTINNNFNTCSITNQIINQ